jgi:hypothetical protein
VILLHAKTTWKTSVGFSATQGSIGMGMNMLQATYDFLNLGIHDFKNYVEVAATYFMMNLNNTAANRILDEWVDCAVNHCQTCMAPSMKKGVKGGDRNQPSAVNLAHRQDQSVLSLLVYQVINQNEDEGKLQVHTTRTAFMNISKFRGIDSSVSWA